MTANVDKTKYGELLMEVLPRKIENEAQNEEFLEVVSKLISKGEDNLSPEENALMDLLVGLIEEFEEKTYLIGNTSTPQTMLLFLMEQNNLKQIDLVDIFGSRACVSEVVNGKRSISKIQAKRLEERFKISAALFI